MRGGSGLTEEQMQQLREKFGGQRGGGEGMRGGEGLTDEQMSQFRDRIRSGAGETRAWKAGSRAPACPRRLLHQLRQRAPARRQVLPRMRHAGGEAVLIVVVTHARFQVWYPWLCRS